MFERYRIIHFVGIGGIGMSGIAEVLYNLGYEVRGSDLQESPTVERLSGMGVKTYLGHRAENVKDAHVVVISSAVKEDNSEVKEARKQGIPVIPRAEMLAELGRLKYAVLVAGSHGKTTTTSLVSTVMAHAGFDPTVIIGGKLKALGTNARLGRGEFIVAEADESDGSFLKLNPTIGVVTNIDREHMDYFKDMESLKEAFLVYMNKVPFYGRSIVCVDDPNVRDLLPKIHRNTMTYGLSPDAELRAKGIKREFMAMSFEAVLNGERLGRFKVPVAGNHNVLNSLAAVGVGLELQISPELIREALEEFEGIQRRLEHKGDVRGIVVYDDYGHHPTEIRATLKAAHESMTGGKLVVVFQPHRYSRTCELMQDFARSFGHADYLVVLDIYAAGENPIDGISTRTLVELMGRKDIYHAKNKKDAVEHLTSIARKGDMVLTLGAGDVYKVGERLVKALKA
jgi:UDP-N-acetylmuramate--alanine ligase